MDRQETVSRPHSRGPDMSGSVRHKHSHIHWLQTAWHQGSDMHCQRHGNAVAADNPCHCDVLPELSAHPVGGSDVCRHTTSGSCPDGSTYIQHGTQGTVDMVHGMDSHSLRPADMAIRSKPDIHHPGRRSGRISVLRPIRQKRTETKQRIKAHFSQVRNHKYCNNQILKEIHIL